MKRVVFFLFLAIVQRSSGQDTSADSSLLFKDTTLLIAKEHCSNDAISCWFGDNVHLDRMLIYNGSKFWENYPVMLFYFSGLDLRNLQQRNNIGYEYLQKVEDFLQTDVKNDSNRIILVNKRRVQTVKRVDTVQYKLYRIKFQYVFGKKSEEFIPNFFDSRKPGSYIFKTSNIYYITKIEWICPFNEIPIKKKRILVK